METMLDITKPMTNGYGWEIEYACQTHGVTSGSTGEDIMCWARSGPGNSWTFARYSSCGKKSGSNSRGYDIFNKKEVHSKTFFVGCRGGVMSEVVCETKEKCLKFFNGPFSSLSPVDSVVEVTAKWKTGDGLED